MLTQERRGDIFDKVDKFIRGGGISPFIARKNGTLAEVAEKIQVPLGELEEHLAMLDQELPPVDSY